MAYVVDFDNEYAGIKYIEITSTQDTVDIQELHDAIRQAEASEQGILYKEVAEASGKEYLSEAVYVAISLKLASTWQIHFSGLALEVQVSGGNLVGGPSDDPVAYTAGVQVLLIQSAAATLVGFESSVSQIENNTQEILGLCFKHSYRYDRVYDGDDNLVSEKMDTYTTQTNAENHNGITGLVGKYQITYTHSGDHPETMLSVRTDE